MAKILFINNRITFLNVSWLMRNFSSATRGRSDSEFYSKICIVTEECDECLFWIDFLTDSEITTIDKMSVLRKEADEVLRIFSSIKKKLNIKYNQKK